MSKAEKIVETQETKLNSPVEIKKAKWTPSTEAVDTWKQYIIQAYKSSKGVYDLKNSKTDPKIPPETRLDQYAGIITFLREKGQFVKQLIKLNNLLVEESKKEPQSTSKILRTVLERELAKFGFQPHMGKVHELLTPSLFREIVKHGLILKDPGLRETVHGDFTHAIQWLMIAWQHQESQFLGGKEDDDKLVVNIYKSLGNDDTVISSRKQDLVGLPNLEATIWGMVLDRLPETYKNARPLNNNKWETDPVSFCAPFNLHLFIINNTIPELNFLKTIIAKRDTKRETESSLTETKTAELINSKLKSSRYSFYSPFPVQLPLKELQDEKNSLRNLILQTDFSEEKTESTSIEIKNHLKIFLTAKEHFDSEDYAKAIKGYLKIEKLYTQRYSTTLACQHLLFNLGCCYKETQNIKLADYYFRRAFHASLKVLDNNALDDKTREEIIPLSEVMTEMATIQHMIRIKDDSEKEQQSSCIIC